MEMPDPLSNTVGSIHASRSAAILRELMAGTRCATRVASNRATREEDLTMERDVSWAVAKGEVERMLPELVDGAKACEHMDGTLEGDISYWT